VKVQLLLLNCPWSQCVNQPLSLFANKENFMPKRILIVDDEPRYLRLLEANLRTEGYEVSTAQDGVQALDVFSAQPIDLVLLDVMMPRLDGLVCQRCVSFRTCHRILTARGEEQDRVRGFDLAQMIIW
jgi:DNA-binding response OmpR family regulator